MDIRLSHKFFSHIKTKRLAKRLGDGAVLGLIKLWTYAAEHFQKGDISELTNDEIAMIAEVDIDPNRFVETLIELRFIDISNGLKKLHEWEKHQPFVYFFEERSRIARQNVEKRWKGQKKEDKQDNKQDKEQDDDDEKANIIKHLRQYGIDDEKLQKLNTVQLDRLLFLVEENRIDLSRIGDIYAYARSLEEPSGYIPFTTRRDYEAAARQKPRLEIPPSERIDENDIQNLMQLLTSKKNP